MHQVCLKNVVPWSPGRMVYGHLDGGFVVTWTVSFGGPFAAVTSGEGAYLPGVLLADAQQAVADGWWHPAGPRINGLIVPALRDMTAVDDGEVTYRPWT
jgi:hypothetical protein